MEEFFRISEILILGLTLLVTVYFSYRSTRIQQKILTIKSAEEFSQSINEKRRALEKILGFSIRHGVAIDPDQLLAIEQDNDKRLALT